MALETKTKEIGGQKYVVTTFPAGRAFELLYELKDALGESFGSLLSSSAESALARIGGKLNKQEAADLVLRLLELTSVGGTSEGFKRETFDAHFAGRIGHLFRVLAFVIEVNYEDFFGELKGAVLTATKKGGELLKLLGAAQAGG